MEILKKNNIVTNKNIQFNQLVNYLLGFRIVETNFPNQFSAPIINATYKYSKNSIMHFSTYSLMLYFPKGAIEIIIRDFFHLSFFLPSTKAL